MRTTWSAGRAGCGIAVGWASAPVAATASARKPAIVSAEGRAGTKLADFMAARIQAARVSFAARDGLRLDLDEGTFGDEIRAHERRRGRRVTKALRVGLRHAVGVVEVLHVHACADDVRERGSEREEGALHAVDDEMELRRRVGPARDRVAMRRVH